jgi:hypothetical protein
LESFGVLCDAFFPAKEKLEKIGEKMRADLKESKVGQKSGNIKGIRFKLSSGR